ncbi:MAG: aspartate--tRNA(Asn) ligase, partial [Candidatus Korarchaeota archaeon]|nr:aspartate--tRNA(Asn) ligase [Candidatus Korarchaeota archaeon]
MERICGHVVSRRRVGRIVFVVLRGFTGMAQLTVKHGEVPEEVWRTAVDLGLEYFVCAEGRPAEKQIARVGPEIIPARIDVLAESRPTPIDLSGKVEAEFPTRIRYRYLDIRRPSVKAVFRIRSSVSRYAREFLYGEGFVELHFPIIIASATEGGAELFPVKYFDRQAYLAQSAQLYKQSAVASFGKVFTIGPSFRAEKSRTRKHLTEFLQIDVEQALASKEELMSLQFRLVRYVYEKVAREHAADLEILGVELEPPKSYSKISYEEALSILRRRGFEAEWGMDFGSDEERALCSEFEEPFFITEFPAGQTAFYYMVSRED